MMAWSHLALGAYCISVGVIWGSIIARHKDDKIPMKTVRIAALGALIWPIVMLIGAVMVKAGAWPKPD